MTFVLSERRLNASFEVRLVVLVTVWFNRYGRGGDDCITPIVFDFQVSHHEGKAPTAC